MRLSARCHHVVRLGLIALGPALALAALLPCSAQQMHRNAFESNRTTWIKGAGDAAYDETVHTMTDQVAHEGQRSEHIQINAKQGSHVYYYYPIANAPIGDELTVGVWVKSNRPGIQLAARVVLPKEADPASLQDRLTTVIRGEAYRKVGGWQLLQIGRTVKLAKEQQQLMQAHLKRPINMEGAYIDKLMLNVYGGTGVTDVWIDELEVGPVFDTPFPKVVGQPVHQGDAKLDKPLPGASKFVELKGSHLQVDGRRFFFRGIRHTDTPPRALRDAGFNTLFIDYPWDPALIQQMVNLGFWLVPSLPVTSEDARFVSAEGVSREIRAFPDPESVLFWNLGTALAHEQSNLVARSVQHVRTADRHRVIGADAWDGLTRYSTSVDLLSVHRWPLMTSMELSQYKEWLEMRSRLAKPGTFLWTWIQTHTPDWHAQLLYQKVSATGYAEPIGPQPEQVRLLTYLAVGSGFRGLGFWSDRFLADSHQGRDRWLTVALLNQELEFLEPLLNSADAEPPRWIDTSDKNVKAAVIRTQKGVLVLPMWLGASAQFVPGQASVAKLSMSVPQVPPSFQAWEVSPGEVRSLKPQRGPNGTVVTLPEFGLTTAIAFTSDLELIQKFQELCWARRQLAAQYTYELAVRELEKVAKIEEQLERAGHTFDDSAELLKDAHNRLQVSKSLWDNHQFGAAYKEAQRALRPARILMRAQWDKSVHGLDAPVASPYAVSFFTLPKHWEFMDRVQASTAAANMLHGGDFEVVPGRPQEAWYPQESTLDDVVLRAERVSEIGMPAVKGGKQQTGPTTLTAKEGRQFLVLEVQPKVKGQPAPKVLERTYLALNSPTVKLTPGTLVRVSGWVAVPEPIRATMDGALLFDSAGGEPLAIRLTGATDWKKFTVYRQVPASGMINVTVALTGLGRVAFDDLRIEPLVGRP